LFITVPASFAGFAVVKFARSNKASGRRFIA